MSHEFSEANLKCAIETADAWYQAFASAREFEILNDSQKEKAGAIIEFFARYAYEYLGLSPAEWDRGVVVECCTDLLPRKVSAKPSFFAAVAPVLSAFFGFLDRQSLLRNGRELAEKVESLEHRIVSQSADRESWGPAKRFVMAAQEAGVDVNNEAALSRFMLEFNMRQLAKSRTAGAPQLPSIFRSLPEIPLKNPRFPPSTSRYDPCPCGSGKKYKFCCEHKV